MSSFNYIQRNGFVMISNLLLDYQDELGLSDSELQFIIKIMRHKPGFAIHDEQLDPKVCSKTLYRKRVALKNKGYLNFTTVREQDPDTGHFTTKGVSYDLTPLEEALQKISDRLNAEKQKTLNKTENLETLENSENLNNLETITNETLENSENLNNLETITGEDPLKIYEENYENYYGIKYVPTKQELDKYNSLSNENKKLIAYIFEYCNDYDLLGKITPRLSLFFKTQFRFTDLKRYCIKNGYVEKIPKQEREENIVPEYVRPKAVEEYIENKCNELFGSEDETPFAIHYIIESNADIYYDAAKNIVSPVCDKIIKDYYEKTCACA